MSPINYVAKSVLVVDDDPDARILVTDALREHGYVVLEAGDGESALTMVRQHHPDLMVLDLGLPGMSGTEVLTSVRASENLPVIILSGRSDHSDRIVGLELGADDYIPKPFDAREVVARVKAVLRRGHPDTRDSTLDFGEITIDISTRDVHCRGALVDLTAKEFDLLAFMAQSPRQVFSREQLLANVWQSSTEWQDASTVNEHVHRLRRKIEADIGQPRLITTLRGAGYRFSPESQQS